MLLLSKGQLRTIVNYSQIKDSPVQRCTVTTFFILQMTNVLQKWHVILKMQFLTFFWFANDKCSASMLLDIPDNVDNELATFKQSGLRKADMKIGF